ncbi:MAG: hypothetical protein KH334_04790, partial [Clostridiales bacterium]|nr:hypothetical protein [Clostridiales bacterium]
MLQDIAPHHFDNSYRPGAPGPEDLALFFGEQGVLLKDGLLPKISDVPEGEYERLFGIDEVGFFLAQRAPEKLPGGLCWQSTRAFRTMQPLWMA